jgi:hypothetical protein
MEKSGRIINGGGYHIKVNKKQKSKNNIGNPLLDDVPFFNETPKAKEFRNKFIYPEMHNNDNNGNLENNFYTEGNYSSSASNKEFRYHKMNINQKYNINKNMKNYISLNNQKYQKKYIDDENGKKGIFKSETQYPFSKRKETLIDNDNDTENRTMKNSSLKNIGFYKKDNNNNLYERTEGRNKQYSLYNYDSNKQKTEKKTIGRYSNEALNKLGHYFYKPLKKKSIINSDKNDDIFYTEYSKENQRYNINMAPSYSYTINDNNYNIKKDNSFNKTNESNDRQMIAILKKKIMNIFMRLMMNIYDNYTKKYFKELISNLRKNMSYSTYNKKFRTKRLMTTNENKRYNEDNNNNTNYFYIKKNNFKINIPNNNNDNLVNSLAINKNFSSMEIYKNAIRRNKNSNDYDNQMFSNNNTNNTNIDNIESEDFKKRSAKNVYIPVKNRNNNYHHLPRQKDSIFNELKINKSSKFFDNPNIIQNQSINTQINNFYNTNNSNFYIHKINSFSSMMSTDKEKPNIFISENSRKNSESPIDSSSKGNIKCPIFRNKRKPQNMIYKKISSNEKSDENTYQNNDKPNIFVKRMERVYNKANRIKKNNLNNINHTYSMKRMNNYNNNTDSIQKQFSTIANYTNTNTNDNNENISPDISNDLNNYNLEDIDKPINMFHIKSNMDLDNEQDNEIVEKDKEDFDIKNIIQIITNDRRLYINLNYVKINKYKNRNKIKKNILYMYKVNNLFILGKKKDKDISFSEAPEKINKNLNKFIRKRTIKSCLMKFDNIINNKIYEYKSLFFHILKNNIFLNIICNIIKNKNLNIIKTFFNILKYSEKKEKNNKANIKNIILDKKNINDIIEDEQIGDINHFQNKEKLKCLIKQINTHSENNNNINIKEFGIGISSLDEEDDIQDIKDRNDNIPLWKSFQINKNDLNCKKSRNIYLRKKVKLNENSTYRSDYKNININSSYQNFQEKIELFRNKMLKHFFKRKSNI